MFQLKKMHDSFGKASTTANECRMAATFMHSHSHLIQDLVLQLNIAKGCFSFIKQ